MPALEFSGRLRNVLAAAREQAMRLQHEFVGTEHLLLALLDDADRTDEPPSVATATLDLIGVDRAKMRRVIDETVLRGRAQGMRDPAPYTARAKAVLERAMAEARVLQHSSVDTDHLLLGLLAEERGIAAEVLLDFGVTADKARGEVARLRRGFNE